MFILIIFVYHTVEPFLLSFDTLSYKDVLTTLHKTNYVISYNNIHMLNAAWLRMVSEDRLHFPYFRKCVTTRNEIDKNNGHQETLTGPGTTHDTNKTIFRFLSTEENQSLPVNGEQERPLLLKDEPSILNDGNLSLLGFWTFFKK